ncbi:hypothetical protein WA556_003883 [Blastocystis sp. ATCC 50177/Nand II]
MAIVSVLQASLSTVILLDVWRIASCTVHSYDESYSLLCIIRLSFLTEKQRRSMRLIHSLLLFLLLLLQFFVVRHAPCPQPVVSFTLLCFPLFFLLFLLNLPLYACQVRFAWVRIVCVFLIPTLLCIVGIYTNSHFAEFVCPSNPSLGVLTKVETILLTVCGVFRMILAIYTKQERALYSRDFEEAYKETEERVWQEMEKRSQAEGVSSV